MRLRPALIPALGWHYNDWPFIFLVCLFGYAFQVIQVCMQVGVMVGCYTIKRGRSQIGRANDQRTVLYLEAQHRYVQCEADV